MSTEFTIFVGDDAKVYTKTKKQTKKQTKKKFHTNTPPKELIETLEKGNGVIIDPNENRVADVSLVGKLEKKPIRENINLANRGRVTNRILFGILKKRSSLIYKTLGEPEWLIPSIQSPEYKKAKKKEAVLKVNVLVLLHKLGTKKRELSIYCRKKDLKETGVDEGFLSNIYHVFLKDKNRILMGNVFNTEKIGCFQLYTVGIVPCGDHHKIGTIQEATKKVYAEDDVVSNLSVLIPQMINKRTSRRGADKFISDGFKPLAAPESLAKKTTWTVNGSDKLYYLLTTESIPEYARPLFNEIMKKFGYRNIGFNAKYLPYKLITPEGDAPSARGFMDGVIYGPSSAAYGEQGESYFTEDQTDWPWITTMKAVFDTLTDKKDLYNFVAKFVPKAIPQLGDGPSLTDVLPSSQKGGAIEDTVMPYSVILETGDKNTVESIMKHTQSAKSPSHGLSVKDVLKEKVFTLKQFDWIFKPTMGAQGKGIFVQYKLKEGDDEDKIIQTIVETIVKERKKEPEYKEWVIAQFLSRPLLFTPFQMNKQITHFYQSTNPKQYTTDLVKKASAFQKNYYKLDITNTKDKKIIEKYGREVLLNPEKQTGIGHKSHLRFYMVMRQDKLTEEISYHMLEESLIFLAAEPYSKCLVAFAEGKFDPVSSGYCNQSNLTKDKQYFKDHRQQLPGYEKAEAGVAEVVVEESVSETSSGVIETAEIISVRGDESDEDEVVGKTIQDEKKIEHIAVEALSQKSEIAFDERFGRGFYKDHILPQLNNIGGLLATIVAEQNIPMNRCANAESDTYLGCAQILAIDVLFTDGTEEGANGIPRGWLLEANTRPGLAGPTAHDLNKTLFEDLLPYLIDPTIEKIQDDLKKVGREYELRTATPNPRS